MRFSVRFSVTLIKSKSEGMTTKNVGRGGSLYLAELTVALIVE
jgi:hypothetical protein